MDWAEEETIALVAAAALYSENRLWKELERQIEAALRQAHARGIEEAAQHIEEYGEVNIEMTNDTVMGDPILHGGPATPENVRASEVLMIQGSAHSAVYHACQHMAANIRALKDGGTDG